MSTNLWPDFEGTQTPRSPKAVVEEAGAGLKEKTNGLVEFYAGSASIKDGKVELNCTLWVLALMYHHPFLRIRFSVEPLYPVTVVADGMSDTLAHDEDELIALLAKIFNAPSTIATIQRLMALAKQ